MGLGFGCFVPLAAQVCRQSTFTEEEELGGLQLKKLIPRMRKHGLMDGAL